MLPKRILWHSKSRNRNTLIQANGLCVFITRGLNRSQREWRACRWLKRNGCKVRLVSCGWHQRCELDRSIKSWHWQPENKDEAIAWTWETKSLEIEVRDMRTRASKVLWPWWLPMSENEIKVLILSFSAQEMQNASCLNWGNELFCP